MVRAAPRPLRNLWAALLAAAFTVIGVALIPPNVGDDSWIWPLAFLAAAGSYLAVYIAPAHLAPRVAALTLGTFATMSRVTVLIFTTSELPPERVTIASMAWTALAVAASVAVVVTFPGAKAATRRRVL